MEALTKGGSETLSEGCRYRQQCGEARKRACGACCGLWASRAMRPMRPQVVVSLAMRRCAKARMWRMSRALGVATMRRGAAQVCSRCVRSLSIPPTVRRGAKAAGGGVLWGVGRRRQCGEARIRAEQKVFLQCSERSKRLIVDSHDSLNHGLGLHQRQTGLSNERSGPTAIKTSMRESGNCCPQNIGYFSAWPNRHHAPALLAW